jgi:hypothetical protein
VSPVDGAAADAPAPDDAPVDAMPPQDALVCDPLTECSGICVDTANDEAHCGDCDSPCGTPANGNSTCVDSDCVLACDDGFDDCNLDPSDGCEIAITAGDALNCGDCGIECGPPQACDVEPCIAVDAAPALASTSIDPMAAIDGLFTITFTEPVAWSGVAAFDCVGAEPASHLVSTSDDVTFQVQVTGTLHLGAVCTITIPAAEVTDLDTDDGVADAMAADAVFTYQVEQLAEDFSGLVLDGGGIRRIPPPGWTFHNVDGRTPAASVSYVNDAWIIREDFAFNVTNFAAFSTSWYEPAGASNDWMFSPPVAIGAACSLTWNALTYDPQYPDGYQVRLCPTTSGTDCAGQAVLFSVVAENTIWTARSADLSALAGQTGYVSFRNNSNDQFLLLIDDIAISCP